MRWSKPPYKAGLWKYRRQLIYDGDGDEYDDNGDDDDDGGGDDADDDGDGAR